MRIDGGRPAAIAAAPAYLKSHSQGEYVFDHGWADAWERAGGDYYPKLQVAVPFTPVPGPRLLARSRAAAELLARGRGGDRPERAVLGARHFLDDAEAAAVRGGAAG